MLDRRADRAGHGPGIVEGSPCYPLLEWLLISPLLGAFERGPGNSKSAAGSSAPPSSGHLLPGPTLVLPSAGGKEGGEEGREETEGREHAGKREKEEDGDAEEAPLSARTLFAKNS